MPREKQNRCKIMCKLYRKMISKWFETLADASLYIGGGGYKEETKLENAVGWTM